VAEATKALSGDSWFERFGEGYRQNGYFSCPSDIYAGFLPFIRRSGQILELGCGNGMLLRYLCEHSNHQLIPFGVDIDPRAIKTARTTILPEFAGNFCVGDVRAHEDERKFDVVLTNPIFANPHFHRQHDGESLLLCSDGSMRRYIERCRSLLQRDGDLILYSYEEEHHRIPNFANVFALETAGLQFEHGLSLKGRTAYWLLESGDP
jgi:tRNA1(Val) A37 N6-methylase TrmN6